MNNDKILYLREIYNKKPLIECAKDLKCEYQEIAYVLRKEGLLDDINIYDVNYILSNINIKALNELGKDLGLTKNQIGNIVNKFSVAKRSKSVSEYTEEEVKNKFKFIIEEKIGKPVNDTLAYELKQKHIQSYEGGYALLKWALLKKEKHKIYKYFSPLAYLFHITYPNMFRPYQFNHTKNTRYYFNTKRYLGELLYIIENKLMIDRENIAYLSTVNGFLNNQQLNFYGLKNFHLDFFENKKNMVNALLDHINQESKKNYESTYKLKEKLKNIDISTDNCFFYGCKNTNIEIHHIYGKRYGFNVDFNLDEVFNLIPLCKQHHYMVKDIDVDILDVNDKNNWRNTVIDYIKDKEPII
ncbi:hypothetical protein ACQR3E_02175 [Clostridium perfringens]